MERWRRWWCDKYHVPVGKRHVRWRLDALRLCALTFLRSSALACKLQRALWEGREWREWREWRGVEGSEGSGGGGGSGGSGGRGGKVTSVVHFQHVGNESYGYGTVCSIRLWYSTILYSIIRYTVQCAYGRGDCGADICRCASMWVTTFGSCLFFFASFWDFFERYVFGFVTCSSSAHCQSILQHLKFVHCVAYSYWLPLAFALFYTLTH